MAAVSVVVPIFNCAAYLPRCLHSLADQTLVDLQVVLVDDGSSDGSREIAAEFVASDERFQLLATPKSGCGPATARNIALANVVGEGLVFVDADDYVPPDALAHLYQILKDQKVDLVIGAHSREADGTEVPELTQGNVNREFDQLCELSLMQLLAYLQAYLAKPNRHALFTSSWARMFRFDVVSQLRFDESLRTFEDVHYNFSALSRSHRVCYTPQTVYSHTLRAGYVSATMNSGGDGFSLFGFVAALSELAVFLRRHWDNHTVESRIGHAMVTYAVIQLIRFTGQIRSGQVAPAFRFHQQLLGKSWLRKALRHYSPDTPAESRWVPRLMKWRLAIGTMLVCYYKAVKRYG